MTETGFVPVGDTRLHYRVEGDGKPVLFLHAGVADSRMWHDQMRIDGHRSVVFDRRGFGQTKWVPGPYADWKDALAVLDHLDIDSAVVVGCSLGGGVAMHLALTAPERVDGLVLVGTAARGWTPEDGWSEEPLEDEAVAAFKAGDFERMVEVEAQLWLAGPKRSLNDIDPGLVDLFRDMDGIPPLTESERDEFFEVFDPPTNDRLDEITAATLVVIGQYDLPDLTESARYLAGRLSDRPVVVIEDTAHLPSLEQPEAFNRALREFLENR